MSAPIVDLFFLCLFLTVESTSAANVAVGPCFLNDACVEGGLECDGVGSCYTLFSKSFESIMGDTGSSPPEVEVAGCSLAFTAMVGQCSQCSACEETTGAPTSAPLSAPADAPTAAPPPPPEASPAPTPSATPSPTGAAPEECVDTAPAGAEDKNGAGCEGYGDTGCDHDMSAYYADSDFTGDEMCCACGGGSDLERLFAGGGPVAQRGPSGAAAACALAAALSAVLAGAAAAFRCARAAPASAASPWEERALMAGDGEAEAL